MLRVELHGVDCVMLVVVNCELRVICARCLHGVIWPRPSYPHVYAGRPLALLSQWGRCGHPIRILPGCDLVSSTLVPAITVMHVQWSRDLVRHPLRGKVRRNFVNRLCTLDRFSIGNRNMGSVLCSCCVQRGVWRRRWLSLHCCIVSS